MKRFISLVACGFVLMGLSACAPKHPVANMEDMDETVYQSVSVSTPGMHGALCTLQVQSRSVTLTTPASVSVPPTASPMLVTCSKGEHFRGSVSVFSQERRVSEGEVAYAYPITISVPMHLNRHSMKREVTVF